MTDVAGARILLRWLVVRLSDVLARRESLALPEVVTLVVGLALDLAELHDAGRGHGAVCAEAVRFDPDGRPRLLPGVAPGDPAADVTALAALGLRALGSRASGRLVEVLASAHLDARELADRVLASGPAAPMRLPMPHRGEISVAEPRRSTLSIGWLLTLLVVARVPASESWAGVLSRLDKVRLAAVTDRSATELRGVYAPGSELFDRDAALIRSLVRRGLSLHGHLAELTGARELSRLGDSAELSVVEQPASYALVDARGRVVVQVRGQVHHLVVHLRHSSAGWRITRID